jgi:hypothetical protein
MVVTTFIGAMGRLWIINDAEKIILVLNRRRCQLYQIRGCCKPWPLGRVIKIKRPVLGRTGPICQTSGIPISPAFIMPRVMRAPIIVVIMVIMPSGSANFSVATDIESCQTCQQNKIESQNYFLHFKPPLNF